MWLTRDSDDCLEIWDTKPIKSEYTHVFSDGDTWVEVNWLPQEGSKHTNLPREWFLEEVTEENSPVEIKIVQSELPLFDEFGRQTREFIVE